MSQTVSPSTSRCYGLARVSRAWNVSRTGVYRFLKRTPSPAIARRRGRLRALVEARSARVARDTWRGCRARGAFRAPACIAFSRERHRLRSPVVAPVRQALVRMLTWPIISAGKSKRPIFTAKAIANYGRDCALPGFARALAGCAG